MITDTKQSILSPSEVIDRLKIVMAAGNFEIRRSSPEGISFRHGTYLTSSAPLLPKQGQIKVQLDENGSRIDYEIEVYGFVKYWMIFIGVIFFWVIFPPLLVHRALVHHPHQLMRNLLQAL